MCNSSMYSGILGPSPSTASAPEPTRAPASAPSPSPSSSPPSSLPPIYFSFTFSLH